MEAVYELEDVGASTVLYLARSTGNWRWLRVATGMGYDLLGRTKLCAVYAFPGPIMKIQ